MHHRTLDGKIYLIMPDLKSWNLWHGCHKYSEGCENCYMYYLDEVRGVPERASVIKKTNDFDKPIRKDRKGRYKIPAGYCLRINMTSDSFLEEADEWRNDMWRMISLRPDVRFYILTKRVGRIKECLPTDWNEGYENVELNISCENQRAFDERWPIFRDIPAKHKGLNLAPLLGPIDITPALSSGQMDNICLGGEGFGFHRPCHYEWIKDLSEQCEKYKVNFTVNAIGSVFIKDGKEYRIEKQDTQGEQAFLSGLSRFYGNAQYKLYDPYDGHLLREDELMKKVYNANKCYRCTSLPTCIGCVDCGSCKDVELVDYDRIISIQFKFQNKRKDSSGLYKNIL